MCININNAQHYPSAWFVTLVKPHILGRGELDMCNMFSVSDLNYEEEEEEGEGEDDGNSGRRGCCEIRLNSAEPEEEYE